jgi:8-oxo-dGTP pyrophosphatase MutT (NUDIX family)
MILIRPGARTSRSPVIPDPATAARPAPLVPRDASTLLLLDRTPSGIHVLMGRRREDLAFNPGAYVCPGGRVDPADGLVPATVEPSPEMVGRLMDRMRKTPSRRRARGLIAAAVRETAEETGYLVGRKSAPATHALPPAYDSVAGADVGLDLSAPVLVGRAITPVNRPRRFDARFFAAFADEVVAVEPTSPVPPDNELADIRFVPLAEARSLELPRITAVMLDELERRLSEDPRLSLGLPAPFYVPRGNSHLRELI